MANQDVTRIASNIGALNSLWALQTVNNKLGVAQTRLSTGRRINSAADDPAGLTIATKLNSRSEGLKVALSNIGDAKNLLAVAEAGVSRITDILVQMKNKASQAASDTMGPSERAAIKKQLNAYAEQIDDIVKQTAWNGNELINGQYEVTKLSFQTGADWQDITDVNGLFDLSATDGNSTQGVTDSLGIAARSTTASASIATANNGMTLLTATAGTADNSNLSVLSSGSYTVRITTLTGTGTDDTIELLDESGNAMLIAANADGSGNVTKASVLNLDGVTEYNFGNGLTVTWGAKGNVEVTQESTVNFTAAGAYDVQKQGESGGDLVTAADYRQLMQYLEGKLDTVNSVMATIGAFTGRLEFKEDQVSAAQINVEASYNRIMNANMAEEQVNSSKFQILQQTAIAMLAQANQAPASLLTLFR